MSAYVLPNIILFVAIVGLLAVIARHIPEAQRRAANATDEEDGSAVRGRYWLTLQGKLRSLWRFVLEAKGLRDPVGSKFRMRQLLAANQRKTRVKQAAVKISAAYKAPESLSELPQQKPAQHPQSPVRASRSETPVAAPQVAPAPAPRPHAPTVHSQVNGAAERQAAATKQALGVEQAMVVAKQYLDNKQYFEARKLLDSLGQDAQVSPVYWARLGFSQYHLGAFGEAIRCYEKSLGLDANQPNRYYNLALAYEAAGNRVKALSTLQKAIQIDPNNPKYTQTRQALTT